METLHVHMNGEHIYDISFQKILIPCLYYYPDRELLTERICIITETHVAPLYLEQITGLLEGKCKEVKTIIFEAGEGKQKIWTPLK